jgi:hypothetical protein
MGVLSTTSPASTRWLRSKTADQSIDDAGVAGSPAVSRAGGSAEGTAGGDSLCGSPSGETQWFGSVITRVWAILNR